MPDRSPTRKPTTLLLVAIPLLLALVLGACNAAFLPPAATVTANPPTPQVNSETLPSLTPPPAGEGVANIPLTDPAAVAEPQRTRLPFNGAALFTITDNDGLAQMVEAGSRWARLDLNWAHIEPSEGKRDWHTMESLERSLVNARASGMEVVLILGGTPPWAEDRSHVLCGGKVDPEKYPALAAFAADMVARYHQPPYEVTFFEFWNEPEVEAFLGCWGDPSDDYFGGEAYGRMLQAVYPAVKQAAPTAQVLTGGLLLDCDPRLGITLSTGEPKDCRPGRFLEGALKAGAGAALDGVSYHGYDYYGGELGVYSNANFAAHSETTGSVSGPKAAYIRDLLAAAGVANKYLINTEAGLICSGPTCSTYEFQSTKAWLAVEQAIQAFADGNIGNIWYSVYGFRESAILRPDLSPYPVYYSFQFINMVLESTRTAQLTNLDPDLFSYELNRSHDRMTVLWNRRNAEKLIHLDQLPSEIVRISLEGKPVSEPLTQDVQVGPAPVFLIYR